MWAERHNVNKTIQNIIVRLIIVLLAVVFGIISITSFSTISRMQGNARVINYAGIVRGATQRLIKQEMNQHPNDELVQYIDSIISEQMCIRDRCRRPYIPPSHSALPPVPP